MRTKILFCLAVSVLAAQAGCVRRVALPPIAAGDQPVDEAPLGMVDVNFVAEHDERTWDVYAGGQHLCTTPCTKRVEAHQFLALESSKGEGVGLPSLGEEAVQARRALLVAEGTSRGKHVNGIVWTTFGGMGVVVGITFAAVGCGNPDRAGLCNAGLITGGISVPLTAVAIWMLVDSLPKLHVLPVWKTAAVAGQPPMTIAVVPNGVVGTF